LDPNDSVRAVIVQGPSNSGKTFSLQLIRRLCRDMQMPTRCIPIEFDISALALTRDCLGLARLVGNALRLTDLNLPTADTGEARLGHRLVHELHVAREILEDAVPTLLMFDHLDKDVAFSVIDFVEALALAAASDRLKQVRVLLIGFPRAPADAFQ